MKILIIEDDPKISSFIAKGLKESGFVSEVALDGQTGLDFILLDKSLDLVILDLMLPKKSGLEVLKEMREAGFKTPVLILSAKRTVDEKVEGLQHGADDYLVKPFAFSELLARVQVLLRRHQPPTAAVTTLSCFGIKMDLLKRDIFRDGKAIELQAKEYTLLEYLMRNPNKAISKTMILENVYHYDFDTQTNIVDVLVFRLRNKIDKDFEKKTIHTIRGVGYVFKED